MPSISQSKRLRARHMCLRCCIRPHIAGLTSCDPCRKLINKTAREHRQRNRNHINACTRAARKKWTAEQQSSERLWHRKRRRELRKSVIKAHGGKCRRCGFKDYRALHVDHRKGNGHQDRMLNRDWKRLVEMRNDALKPFNKRKYQLLCANCNFIKKFSDKEL